MAAAILKAMSKMEAMVSSFALQNTPTLQFTIDDKIVACEQAFGRAGN